MWKSAAMRLNFSPRDGQSVEIHGSMSFYAASGQAQLISIPCNRLAKGSFSGISPPKNKLEAEGLFSQTHKRPLPELPRQIGVITSATGAALQDILKTLSRRLPLLQVFIAPSLVQGVDAPTSLLKSLNSLTQIEGLDLIIIARGGGSIEDLWAFNDENLARAIFNSPVPVISGVGHETDFTIADFVADMRAPTPTAAAELATPITINELALSLQGNRKLLKENMQEAITERSYQLELRHQDLKRLSPIQRVNNAMQTLDNLQMRLDRTMRLELQKLSQKNQHLSDRLESLSPLAVLKRGFAIVSDAHSKQLINQTKQSSPNQAVNIRFFDGEIPATLNPNQQEKI